MKIDYDPPSSPLPPPSHICLCRFFTSNHCTKFRCTVHTSTYCLYFAEAEKKNENSTGVTHVCFFVWCGVLWSNVWHQRYFARLNTINRHHRTTKYSVNAHFIFHFEWCYKYILVFRYIQATRRGEPNSDTNSNIYYYSLRLQNIICIIETSL